MLTIAEILNFLLDIYMIIVVVSALVTWLIAFEVISTTNQQTANLVTLLNRLTEPVYKPLRKYIQPIGGVDVTPIVVIIIIFILQKLIVRIALM